LLVLAVVQDLLILMVGMMEVLHHLVHLHLLLRQLIFLLLVEEVEELGIHQVLVLGVQVITAVLVVENMEIRTCLVELDLNQHQLFMELLLVMEQMVEVELIMLEMVD
jgi:hypothetical protein